MVDNLSSFVNWLNSVMAQKGLSQADIARTKIVTSSAVSLLFSLRIKSVGTDMCRAIAAATGIPLETVYRQAGLLPNVPASDGWAEEMLYKLSQIKGLNREIAVKMLDVLIEEQDRNEKPRVYKTADT